MTPVFKGGKQGHMEARRQISVEQALRMLSVLVAQTPKRGLPPLEGGDEAPTSQGSSDDAASLDILSKVVMRVWEQIKPRGRNTARLGRPMPPTNDD
jgi:hypothetical protein